MRALFIVAAHTGSVSCDTTALVHAATLTTTFKQNSLASLYNLLFVLVLVGFVNGVVVVVAVVVAVACCCYCCCVCFWCFVFALAFLPFVVALLSA